jgi:aminoglycoside phosphotransferase (APT) family kinase protein
VTATRGSLGEKISGGNWSDVHAWAPGQVVKLFKAGIPRSLSEHEARMTRAALVAGLPAPEVFDQVTVEGRFGIVLQRLDGPTVLQLMRTGAMTFGQAGMILAALFMSVHNAPPPPDVYFVRDWISGTMRIAGHRLPPAIATGILPLLDRLRPADGRLCHGDLNPANVIMTAEGPRLVDWTWAMRGPAALDLAFLHVVLTEIAPHTTDDPKRPAATHAAVWSEYARLAGLSREALTVAVEAYVPVVCAIQLLVGVTGALRDRMIQHVEAALGGQQMLGPV